jgi:hypothetical protein
MVCARWSARERLMKTFHVFLAITLFVMCAISVAAQVNAPITFQQIAELTASDGAAQDYLGYSLAMSGNTVVAGAPVAPGGTGPGKAYVFVKPAAGWANATQMGALIPSDGVPELQFGLWVAISGNTIAVYAGANETTVPAAVYIFVEPAGGWTDMTETAKLVLPDAIGGGSLAISGNIVAVSWTGLNFDQGEIYIYAMPQGGWRNGLEPLAYLTASDGKPDDFLGVDLSFYGDTLVAGAPNRGAYVFVKPPSGWATGTETAKLTELAGTGLDAFGNSVAISEGAIVVGAFETGNARNQGYGAAYIYYEPATGWTNATQSVKIKASDAAPLNYFGASVAVSRGLVAVGAYGAGNAGTGAAYVFFGGHQVAELTPGNGISGEGMGDPIAANGNIIVAAASDAAVGLNYDQGILYVFAP